MKQTVIFLLLILLFASGCASVPLTGRRQLSLVSSGEMTSLSEKQYKEVLSQSKVVQSGAQIEQIRRVGARITKAVDAFAREKNLTLDYAWEFNLIRDEKQVNAWCMPGGKVAFYTGIMPVCKDDAGVATVMGHEIAHAIAEHSRERFSQQMLAQLGNNTVALMVRNKPASTQKIFMTAAGLGTQVGVMLPFSRLHESEADHIGLMLMARAGYDPRTAVDFWTRMQTGSGARPPEFLSTHPAGATRISAIEAQLPDVMPYYHAYKGAGSGRTR
jgi:predicted Zn-dependent protease